MTFKEDYRAIFDQLQPSEQLLAATAALNSRPNPTRSRRFRLPAAAVSLCTICLLLTGVVVGSLQLGQPSENQQTTLRTAQQPQLANSRSIDAPNEPTQETAMRSLPEPQIAEHSANQQGLAAYQSPGKASRTNCYPQSDTATGKMAYLPAPPASLWLTSPSLPVYFYQTALWLSHWSQFK